MPATRPDIPVIDLAPLRTGGTSGLAAVAATVGRACRDTGFFVVAGTGVPQALQAAVFEAARALFSADPAVKEAVSIRRSPHNRGYVGLRVEALDPGTAPDPKEAFNVGLDLSPDDPEVLAGRPFRGSNLGPALPRFREPVLAYYEALWGLGRALHRAVAVDLGLDQTFFDPHLDRPLATLRLLHYPPAEAGADPALGAGQHALGAGQHTDYGNLTLLATDAVGGLQVRARDGCWIDVPSVPDTFVCNIGDLLMRWTNDVYVSTPHRVLRPVGRDRYSVAFFLDPDPDALVACLPGCRGPGGAERYPPVTAATYLAGRLDATYNHRAAP